MLREGSKSRLLFGFSLIFASILIAYGLIYLLSSFWAMPVTVALAGCWIIYFIYRWQIVPPSYDREFTRLIALTNISSLLEGNFVSFDSWSMDPDALIKILSYVQTNNCKVVFECGSGISTLAIGKLLKQTGQGHLYSIEENEHWYARVANLIETQDLGDFITLVYAPIEQQEGMEQGTRWYAASTIESLMSKLSHIDLLIVDGPSTVDIYSRFPALPVLFPRLGKDSLIILDDVNRSQEIAVLNKWQKTYRINYEVVHGTRRSQAYIHLP
jgi:predicted O-methyltransferase YrrM